MKLFDKRAEVRIHSPRFLRRRGFYQFLGMLIISAPQSGQIILVLVSAILAPPYFREMFSRPYRNVWAIQISSFKNLSVRLTKEASSRLPDSSKSF